PRDRESVRKEHQQLELQEKAIYKSLDGHRAELRALDGEIERQGREREQAQAQLGHFDAQLKEQDLGQKAAQAGVTRALKQLPAAWKATGEKVGIRELNALDGERADLEQEGIDGRGKELHQARLNLDVMRQDLEALEAEQGRFPEEARQDPGALAGRLQEA